MSSTIDGKQLTSWDVSADGSHARLGLSDGLGKAVSVQLPEECVAALMMTLPRVMEQMIQRRYPDPMAKLVFPAKDWRVELAHDRASLILTLATPDGFSASFFLSPESSRSLGEALSAEHNATQLQIAIN